VPETVDRQAGRATGEVPGARVALVLLGAAWIVVLVLYLRHAIVLSSDSINNHVHVWYVARDVWHHARLPWRMPVLAHGDAFAYPYGFVNWTTAALAWPLFGNWVVTLWTALGVVGCIVATFVAFPELRSGWWAAAVLANPAIIDALLFGQQSFAWGSMLLLFGVAAWRRGHPAWAAVLVGLGQANHAAIVLPIGVLLVAFALVISRDRLEILRWYALSLAITLPAIWLVFASPTTVQTGTGAEIVDFFGTLGPRVFIVALPILCVVLQRTGIPALAPVGLVVALVAGLSFEVPLNVGQQWHALVRKDADTASLDAFLRSPEFVPGLTYRVLRAGDGKLGLFHVLRAGGRLDSEMFPESMAGDRSFHDPGVYAAFLCARKVDRILHDDTHDETRHTDEIEMIDALEREPHRGVGLRRIASGVGWQADAVDRSGCTTPS
jgi:hypothetical protein